jgi:hypothetical protein
LLPSPPAALRQGNAQTAVNHVVDVVVVLLFLFQSPPTALGQGNARAAVDHVVDGEVLAPVTTRSPQTGKRADGSQPCSRRCSSLALSFPITTCGPQSGYRAGGSRPCGRHGRSCSCSNPQSPPAALSQGIAREAVDHVVAVEDLALAPIPNHHPRPSVRVSRGRQLTMLSPSKILLLLQSPITTRGPQSGYPCAGGSQPCM